MKSPVSFIMLGFLIHGSVMHISAQSPQQAPGNVQHIWDAKVTIDNGITLGESKYGWRRIVPITGGTFEGPDIRGEVLPLGEDWQPYRPGGRCGTLYKVRY